METLVQLLITCEALLRKLGEIFWADKTVAAEDEAMINERLSAIRSKIYQEAIRLRRQ